MSWSGFKKNVGRATTQVMMKTGHVEKTSDRDYEVEERRYRTLESASLRLQKEAKGYLDSLRAMTASQMRIAETIDAFYGDSGARDGVSRSYKQAVEDLDAETVKALDGPYRCVSRYPKLKKEVPPPPREEDDPGAYREEVLAEVEAELNFTGGSTRCWTKGLRKEGIESDELMDHVYRTTVLEPINRFCAYFPDINECIKKRNHKMLDYDAMRSRVKKLTEKPDKDPGKLPRTEKETEMVKLTHHSRPKVFSDDVIPLLALDEGNDGSVFPSPPKVLNGLKDTKKLHEDVLAEIKAEEDAALRSVGLKHRSSVMNGISRKSSMMYKAFWGLSQENAPRPTSMEPLLLYSPTGDSPRRSSSRSSVRTSWRGLSSGVPMAPFSPKSRPSPPAPVAIPKNCISAGSAFGSVCNPVVQKQDRDALPKLPTKRSIGHARAQSADHQSCQPVTPMRRAVLQAHPSQLSGRSRESSGDNSTPRITVTPARPQWNWFDPSELEELMQPLKKAFLEDHTNLFAQAKAAYEQLNEQLTDELPKLIDLRVPYLDPSFEALVKIQLRFCAEAYSRMAQVQQYLDASTRDQYASGDLDARVEDVLGQIRELSIAGTV